MNSSREAAAQPAPRSVHLIMLVSAACVGCMLGDSLSLVASGRCGQSSSADASPEFPLSRPCVAPGDRQVSPSLRTLRARLLLSHGKGSVWDRGLAGLYQYITNRTIPASAGNL